MQKRYLPLTDAEKKKVVEVNEKLCYLRKELQNPKSELKPEDFLLDPKDMNLVKRYLMSSNLSLLEIITREFGASFMENLGTKGDDISSSEEGEDEDKVTHS